MKKAKAKKAVTRRARTGVGAAPTESFRWFKEYFRTELDEKQFRKLITEYFTDVNKVPFDMVRTEKEMESMPNWVFSLQYHFAAYIAWQEIEETDKLDPMYSGYNTSLVVGKLDKNFSVTNWVNCLQNQQTPNQSRHVKPTKSRDYEGET